MTIHQNHYSHSQQILLYCPARTQSNKTVHSCPSSYTTSPLVFVLTLFHICPFYIWPFLFFLNFAISLFAKMKMPRTQAPLLAPSSTPLSWSSLASFRWLSLLSPTFRWKKGEKYKRIVLQAYDWAEDGEEPAQVDLSRVTTPHALYLAEVIVKLNGEILPNLLSLHKIPRFFRLFVDVRLSLGKWLPSSAKRLRQAHRWASQCCEGDPHSFCDTFVCV